MGGRFLDPKNLIYSLPLGIWEVTRKIDFFEKIMTVENQEFIEKDLCVIFSIYCFKVTLLPILGSRVFLKWMNNLSNFLINFTLDISNILPPW